MDIHTIRTADHVELHLLYLPASGASRGTWLFTHGVGSSFYRAPLLPIGQELSRRGFDVALLNNRGHDWMWLNRPDNRWLGAAYERIEDATLDVDAAVQWLAARGHSRLVLAGHSLGAVKAGYVLAHRRPREVFAAALCSGPRLPGSPSGSPAEITAALARAEELMAAGHPDEMIFLTGRAFTARTYVDKYARDAKTATLSYVRELRMPVLFLAGASGEGYSDLPMLEHARDLYAAFGPSQGTLVEIEGADHLYAGHELDVANALASWREGIEANLNSQV